MGRDTDDRMLIAAIGRGEAQALQALFLRHQVRVFRFLMRLTGNKAVAEELLNEVFLGVWQTALRYEGRSEPLTWVLSIAHNKAVSWLRKRRETTGFDEDAVAQIADESETPDITAQKADKARLMRQCIGKLSPDHREILDLVYYQERTILEVADILSIPENTVKTRMFHARKKLSVLLQASGIDRGWP